MMDRIGYTREDEKKKTYLTPLLAYMNPVILVNCSNAALVVEYPSWALPIQARAEMEARLVIAPEPCFSMMGSTSWQQR